MGNAADASCPFSAGNMITDSKFFVGRVEEIRWILRNMTGDQPTSVNIVGDRHIGKSSLLYHVYQTYEGRVGSFGRRPEEFVVVYVSLKDGDCRKPADFYRAIAQKLLERPDQSGIESAVAGSVEWGDVFSGDAAVGGVLSSGQIRYNKCTIY